MVAALLQYSALAVFYSLLATAMLEALLRLWRVQDPPLAAAFRLPILALPPAAPLLFPLLSPNWGTDPFRQQWALLQLRNWLGPEPSISHPGWVLLLGTLAATTLVLLGLEAAGHWRQLLRRPRDARGPLPLPRRLLDARTRLEARGAHPFSIQLSNRPDPTACAVGLRHPTVLLTTALVDMLDDEELEAVIAHELAHVRRRDNWLGWLLLGLRLVSFYNPVAWLTFHRIGHDMESVCDAEAGRVTGKPLALASALLKVYRASRASHHGSTIRPRWAAGRAAALENRARRALIEDRLKRLVHPEQVPPASYPRLRLLLASASVVATMSLVVY
ncbi:MAG: M56 family metallopeptidase [Sphingomonadaceae bacterium]